MTSTNNHNELYEQQIAAIQSTLRDQNQVLALMQKNQEAFHKSCQPMLEWFGEMNLSKKIRLDFLKSASIWSGVLIGLGTVFGGIWLIFKFLVMNVK